VTDYIRRSDAERLSAQHAAHIAEIERDLVARITDRVTAGDDWRIVNAEEVARALERLNALSTAFKKALQALPTFPGPTK
jgi:hypothetical protein